ncbi:MAG: hypothetical protein HC834_03430 [Rhodospirillales bacterium]|nr:hypothetical protein [Rhodospirillales bacterium]
MIARDDVRLARLSEALAYFAADVERIELPAWDCLPYDRTSPHPDIVSRRVDALSSLAAAPRPSRPRVVLTTVAAVLQRMPPRETWEQAKRAVQVGEPLDRGELIAFLQASGFVRVETVSEAGECAVRGGIIDLFPAGMPQPVRIDLFGDEVESLRTFDPTSQRTTDRIDRLDLRPVSEVPLDDEGIRRFRAGYRLLAAAAATDDPLYAAISAGHRHPGMEHWLPLFHERLETLFDYLPKTPVVVDHQLDEALTRRLEAIEDYYQARRTIDAGRFTAGAAAYHPVPTDQMFLDRCALDAALASRPVLMLSPFAVPASEGQVWDAGGRSGLDFQKRGNVLISMFSTLLLRRYASTRVHAAG